MSTNMSTDTDATDATDVAKIIERIKSIIPDRIKHTTEKMFSFIDENRDGLIVAPTGSGKTFAILYWIAKTIEERGGFENLGNEKIIVCVPTRVLAHQHYETISKIFGSDKTALIIGHELGKWITTAMEIKQIDMANIIITTYHRAVSLLASRKDIIGVVCDEVHTVETNKYVDYVSCFLSRNLMLSATINERDAQLIERSYLFIPDDELKTNRKIIFAKNRETIEIFNKKITADIVEIIHALLFEEGEYSGDQILVFVDSRKKTKIYRDMLIKSGIDARRIAVHHAGMSDEERADVEDSFRRGDIYVIIATTTLAMGVNLPADHVIVMESVFRKSRPIEIDRYGCRIVHDISRYAAPIDKRMIRQMFGRCGRDIKTGKTRGINYAIYIGENAKILEEQDEPPLLTEVFAGNWLVELSCLRKYANHESITERLYRINIDRYYDAIVKKDDMEKFAKRIGESGIRYRDAISITKLLKEETYIELIKLLSFSLTMREAYDRPLEIFYIVQEWIRGMDIEKIYQKHRPNTDEIYTILLSARQFAYAMWHIIQNPRMLKFYISVASGIPPQHYMLAYIGLRREYLQQFLQTLKYKTTVERIKEAVMQMSDDEIKKYFIIDRDQILERIEYAESRGIFE